MPAWNDDSVRSDGFMNSRPRILPASACGSGCSCRRRGEGDQVDDLVAGEIGEIEEALHGKGQ